MSYRIVKQYRATGGLTMTEDGFFTITDPSYYEDEEESCSAAFHFDCGIQAAQKLVMAMAPIRKNKKFTQQEVIAAIEAGREKSCYEHDPKLPIIIIQIVVEDDPGQNKPIPLKM